MQLHQKSPHPWNFPRAVCHEPVHCRRSRNAPTLSQCTSVPSETSSSGLWKDDDPITDKPTTGTQEVVLVNHRHLLFRKLGKWSRVTEICKCEKVDNPRKSMFQIPKPGLAETPSLYYFNNLAIFYNLCIACLNQSFNVCSLINIISVHWILPVTVWKFWVKKSINPLSRWPPTRWFFTSFYKTGTTRKPCITKILWLKFFNPHSKWLEELILSSKRSLVNEGNLDVLINEVAAKEATRQSADELLARSRDFQKQFEKMRCDIEEEREKRKEEEAGLKAEILKLQVCYFLIREAVFCQSWYWWVHSRCGSDTLDRIFRPAASCRSRRRMVWCFQLTSGTLLSGRIHRIYQASGLWTCCRNQSRLATAIIDSTILYFITVFHNFI